MNETNTVLKENATITVDRGASIISETELVNLEAYLCANDIYAQSRMTNDGGLPALTCITNMDITMDSSAIDKFYENSEYNNAWELTFDQDDMKYILQHADSNMRIVIGED